MLLVYDAKADQAYSVDAEGTAPQRATIDWYKTNQAGKIPASSDLIPGAGQFADLTFGDGPLCDDHLVQRSRIVDILHAVLGQHQDRTCANVAVGADVSGSDAVAIDIDVDVCTVANARDVVPAIVIQGIPEGDGYLLAADAVVIDDEGDFSGHVGQAVSVNLQRVVAGAIVAGDEGRLPRRRGFEPQGDREIPAAQVIHGLQGDIGISPAEHAATQPYPGAKLRVGIPDGRAMAAVTGRILHRGTRGPRHFVEMP